MNFNVHPAFEHDLRRFEGEYALVYAELGLRFHREVVESLLAIQTGPNYAGHLIKIKSEIIAQARRRNLHSFPFFVLYGMRGDAILITSLVHGKSNPANWLKRLRYWEKI